MDDLQFEKPVWSLYEALHWIAFRRHDAPATGDSATRFEQAEVDLLGEWQDGNISPRGREKGSGTPQEIPRDFSTKAEFEPIGNSIYQEGWWQPEPRWKEVCFFRADVLVLWPDIPWADESGAPKGDGEGGAPRTPGRPSLEAEIRDAYLALERDKEVDFAGHLTALYEPVRERVREALGDPTLSKGLGQETIRKTIGPLFKGTKAKH